LALFAVYGTSKALDYQLSPLSATLLGMLSGIGGGIARDLLVARTPVVLQAELYAVAALAGGGLVAIGHMLAVPQAWSL
ncbi:MAG: trimeric intracellular cation channel family protein, partial [Xanthomonas perforans]|nr:trimeric intracellular cation channel family protein [Xanthomonas perforans]